MWKKLKLIREGKLTFKNKNGIFALYSLRDCNVRHYNIDQ